MAENVKVSVAFDYGTTVNDLVSQVRSAVTQMQTDFKNKDLLPSVKPEIDAIREELTTLKASIKDALEGKLDVDQYKSLQQQVIQLNDAYVKLNTEFAQLGKNHKSVNEATGQLADMANKAQNATEAINNLQNAIGGSGKDKASFVIPVEFDTANAKISKLQEWIIGVQNDPSNVIKVQIAPDTSGLKGQDDPTTKAKNAIEAIQSALKESPPCIPIKICEDAKNAVVEDANKLIDLLDTRKVEDWANTFARVAKENIESAIVAATELVGALKPSEQMGIKKAAANNIGEVAQHMKDIKAAFSAINGKTGLSALEALESFTFSETAAKSFGNFAKAMAALTQALTGVDLPQLGAGLQVVATGAGALGDQASKIQGITNLGTNQNITKITNLSSAIDNITKVLNEIGTFDNLTQASSNVSHFAINLGEIGKEKETLQLLKEFKLPVSTVLGVTTLLKSLNSVNDIVLRVGSTQNAANNIRELVSLIDLLSAKSKEDKLGNKNLLKGLTIDAGALAALKEVSPLLEKIKGGIEALRQATSEDINRTIGILQKFDVNADAVSKLHDIGQYMGSIGMALALLNKEGVNFNLLSQFSITKKAGEDLSRVAQNLRDIHGALRLLNSERAQTALDVLKTFTTDKTNTDNVNALATAFRTISAALSSMRASFDDNKQIFAEIRDFSPKEDDVINIMYLADAFKAFGDAAKKIKGAGNFMTKFNGFSMKEEQLTGVEKLAKALKSLDGMTLQKGLGDRVSSLAKGFGDLTKKIKDVNAPMNTFLGRIIDILKRSEELKNLATIVSASMKQIEAAQQGMTVDEQKTRANTISTDYKIVIDNLKEITRLRNATIKDLSLEEANNQRIKQLTNDIAEKRKEIHELEGEDPEKENKINNLLEQNNQLRINIDTKKEQAKIEQQLAANRQTADAKIQEANALLEKQKSLINDIADITMKRGKYEGINEATQQKYLNERYYDLAITKGTIIDIAKETSKLDGVTKTQLKQLTDIENKATTVADKLTESTEKQAKNWIANTEALKADSSEWANAKKIVDGYNKTLGDTKQQLLEISKIDRVVRRNPKDENEYFVSYNVTGKTGDGNTRTTTFGANGDLLKEKDDIISLQKLYQELEASINRYGAALKGLDKDKNVAQNYRVITDEATRQEHIFKLIDDYKKQGLVYGTKELGLIDKETELRQRLANIEKDNLSNRNRELITWNREADELGSATGKINQYYKKVEQLRALIEQYTTLRTKATRTDEEVSRLKDVKQQITDIIKELKKADYDPVNRNGSITNFTNANEIQQTLAAMDGIVASSVQIQTQGQNVIATYSKMNGESVRQKYIWQDNIQSFRLYSEEVTKSSFLERMTKSITSAANYFKRYFSGYMIVQRFISSVRNAITTVSELDKQFVEMQKVSDESNYHLMQYMEEAHELAKSVGSTTTTILSSTADYMRLGKTLSEAKELAQQTAILMNVSEFDNISDATDALIAMTQAYQNMDSMDIIDKLNKIGKLVA